MTWRAPRAPPQFFGEEREGEAKYEVSHVIGKGSYGTVWCARPAPGRPAAAACAHARGHRRPEPRRRAPCRCSAARNRHTGEKVAIKHIDRVFADKADTVRIIRELRFLRVLKHPNVRPAAAAARSPPRARRRALAAALAA